MAEDFPPEVDIIRVRDAQGRGGLYNLLFPGALDRGAALLPVIGINPEAAAAFRFRDCWPERDGTDRFRIHVYTRIGGGNRPEYAEAIKTLRALPTYERDADDGYDTTYASFWFRVPDQFAAPVARIAVDPIDTAQRWRDVTEKIGQL
jgi:hypothetical protein